ncbi:MAG: tetratricopeptide repeat protein [Sphingobacteriaceae bacterium]|nr:tetratricopeptide repeat protein [Sphingobacteriaceae bacterium]
MILVYPVAMNCSYSFNPKKLTNFDSSMKGKIFISILLFGFTYQTLSQDKVVDSLKNKRNELKVKPASFERDTTLAQLDLLLAKSMRKYDLDEASKFGLTAFQQYAKLYNYKNLAYSTHQLAIIYRTKGEYDKSKVFAEAMLTFSELIGDTLLISEAYGTIANVHVRLGNEAEGLNYHFKALKLREILKHEAALISTYNNIGFIYLGRNEQEKANEYLFKCLKIKRKNGDSLGVAELYSNIASGYDQARDFKTAYLYHSKALEILKEANEPNLLANEYNNIGGHYYYQNKIDSMLSNQKRALTYYLKLNHLSGISGSYINIGSTYLEMKKYKEAEEYLLKSLNIYKSTHNAVGMVDMLDRLRELFEAKKEFDVALKYNKLYHSMKDSIGAISNSREMGEIEERFKNEKLKAQREIEFKKEKENQEAQAAAKNKQKNIILAFVLIILVVMAAFSRVLYNRFKITKQQNVLIEKQKQEVQVQKEIIEAKQKDILDSIAYASRIQRSLLPNEKLLSKYLNKNKG